MERWRDSGRFVPLYFVQDPHLLQNCPNLLVEADRHSVQSPIESPSAEPLALPSIVGNIVIGRSGGEYIARSRKSVAGSLRRNKRFRLGRSLTEGKMVTAPTALISCAAPNGSALGFPAPKAPDLARPWVTFKADNEGVKAVCLIGLLSYLQSGAHLLAPLQTHQVRGALERPPPLPWVVGFICPPPSPAVRGARGLHGQTDPPDVILYTP